jgi:hypothetical protein
MRVKSTSSAILAMVQIYCSFGSLNILKNAPLRTPPVPISQALNPESQPPMIPIYGFADILRFGFQREYAAKVNKTVQNTILRKFWSMELVSDAQRTVNTILGIPKRKKIRQFICFRKKKSRELFQNI